MKTLCIIGEITRSAFSVNIALILLCMLISTNSYAQRKLIAKDVPYTSSKLVFYGDALGMQNKATKTAHSDDWLMGCDYQYWLGNNRAINFQVCYLNQFEWYYREMSIRKELYHNYLNSVTWDGDGEKSLKMSRGTYRYHKFTKGDRYCFAIRMIFGVNGESGQPDRKFNGFYCQKTDGLDQRTIEAILNTFGYKHDRFGYEAVKPVGLFTNQSTKDEVSKAVTSPPQPVAEKETEKASKAVSCFNNPTSCAPNKEKDIKREQSGPEEKGTVISRLRNLKTIYKEGLINKEDYERKKKAILDKM